MDSYSQVKTSEFHPVQSVDFNYFYHGTVLKFNVFDNPVSFSTRSDAEIPSCWLQAILAHMLLSATQRS